MANTPYYHASLRVDANVRIEQNERGRYEATIAVDGHELPLRSNQNMLEQILKRGTQPSDRYRLVLSPRTNKDATLRPPDLRLLRHHDDLNGTERDTLGVGFSALGQLVYIGEGEDHRIGLRIYPNPGGRLRKLFTLSVGLEPFLFNTLPPLGYGLSVSGHFDGDHTRIVVTRTETVALPRRKASPVSKRASRPATKPARSEVANASAEAKTEPQPDTAPQKPATHPQDDVPNDDVSTNDVSGKEISNKKDVSNDDVSTNDVSNDDVPKPKRRRVRVSYDKS